MTSKYFIANLYFLIIDGNKLAWLRRKFYIVNNLKVKLLIRINILNFKGFIINLPRNKAYILIYNIDILIVSLLKREQRITRVIRLNNRIIILSYIKITIIIQHASLPADRDYLFKSIYNIPVTLFIYVVDSDFNTIFIENKSDIIIILLRRLRLSKVIDYK